MKTLMVATVVLAMVVGFAGEAGAQDDPVRDTVDKVLMDLDGIEAEARRFSDTAAAQRMMALVERARGRLQKLAPRASAAAKPGASAAQGGPAGGAGAGGAPSGHAGGSKGGPMPDKEFKDVIRVLKAQSLDGPRLGVIQNAIDGGGFFTSAQVGQLVHWLTGDDMRVEAAARLYGRCTDTPNFNVVFSLLDSDASRQKLKERIAGGSAPESPAPVHARPGGGPK